MDKALNSSLEFLENLHNTITNNFKSADIELTKQCGKILVNLDVKYVHTFVKSGMYSSNKGGMSI